MNRIYTYREKLIEITLLLKVIIDDVYVYGINIGVLNELKDLFGVFSLDEEIPADVELLKALSDPAVKPLIQILLLVNAARESLININVLPEEAGCALDQPEYWPEFLVPEDISYKGWLVRIIDYLHTGFLSVFHLTMQLDTGGLALPLQSSDLFCYADDKTLALLSDNDQNVNKLKDLLVEVQEQHFLICEICFNE